MTAYQEAVFAQDIKRFTLRVRAGNTPTITQEVDAHDVSVTFENGMLRVVFYNRVPYSTVETDFREQVVSSYGYSDVSSYAVESGLPSWKINSAVKQEVKQEEKSITSPRREEKGNCTWSVSDPNEFCFPPTATWTRLSGEPRQPTAKDLGDAGLSLVGNGLLTEQEAKNMDAFVQAYERACDESTADYLRLVDEHGTAEEASANLPLYPTADKEVRIERSAKEILLDGAAERTVQDIDCLRDALAKGLGGDEPITFKKPPTALEKLTEIINETMANDPLPAIKGLHKFDVTFVDTAKVEAPQTFSYYSTYASFNPADGFFGTYDNQFKVTDTTVITVRATKA